MCWTGSLTLSRRLDLKTSSRTRILGCLQRGRSQKLWQLKALGRLATWLLRSVYESGCRELRGREIHRLRFAFWLRWWLISLKGSDLSLDWSLSHLNASCSRMALSRSRATCYRSWSDWACCSFICSFMSVSMSWSSCRCGGWTLVFSP